jgi:outer membrane protein
MIACFLMLPTLQAQETFSLQQLLQLSLDHNYQIQMVRNQQQMAENMNTAGNAGMLPSVMMGAERSWQIMNTEINFFTGETRSGENALNTSLSGFVEADWVVFDGFSMFARRNRLQTLAELGSTETRYFIQQTAADVAIVYYQLLKESQLLRNMNKSLEVSAFRHNLERQKRNVGTGNALLYHQALIDLNADSTRVSQQIMLIRDLQIRINRLINRDPMENIVPADEMIALQGIDTPDELLRKTLDNNLDLQRAYLEEMLAEANLRAERGNRYPQVSVFGGYSFLRQTSELGFAESTRNYGGNFGIRVRFNLYDGGRQNTIIRNEVLQQQNAAIEVDDQRAFVYSELSRLHNAYVHYQQQYRMLEQSILSAQRSLLIAQQQLETGTISGVEFRQTQLAALQVENLMSELLYSMKVIEIDLLRVSGELMERLL